MRLRTFYDNQDIMLEYPDRAYAFITKDKNRIIHEMASMLFEIAKGNEYYKILHISDEKLIIQYTTYNNKTLTSVFEDIGLRLFN